MPKPSSPLPCTCLLDSRSDPIGPTGPVGLEHGRNKAIQYFRTGADAKDGKVNVLNAEAGLQSEGPSFRGTNILAGLVLLNRG